MTEGQDLMSASFRIVARLDAPSREYPRPQFGVLYAMAHGSAFPERGWTDFVEVLIRIWATTILGMLVASERKNRLIFLDGSYAIMVLRRGDGFRLVGMDTGPDTPTKTGWTADVGIVEMFHELHSASRTLLRDAKTRKYPARRTASFEALEMELRILHRLCKAAMVDIDNSRAFVEENARDTPVEVRRRKKTR